jgi:hypothetical protein
MKILDIINEVSLGDYHKKASMNRALSQMSAAFGKPEDKEKHLHKAAQREKGLARAKVRTDKFWAEKEAKEKAEREAAIRAKYADVDIDAEIAKLQPAIKRAYNDYQYGARNTWHQGKEEYDRLKGQLYNLEQAKKILGKLDETATAGSTSAGNVGTVVSPHLAIGKDRGNKSYTGSPGQSGTKAPKVPKTVQKKNADGTAKNALDMPNNIFGGGAVKR